MTTALSLASLDSERKEKSILYSTKIFPLQIKSYTLNWHRFLWTSTLGTICQWTAVCFSTLEEFLSGLRSKALQRVGPPMENSTSCQRNFQPFTSSWSEKLWTQQFNSWKLSLMSAVMSTEWWLMPETDSETQQHEALIKRTVGLFGVGLYEVLGWGQRQRQNNVF